MKRKYFQIKMDPAHHEQMKFRANQLGVPIGEYLENLISSMELRVAKAYKKSGIQEGLVDQQMLRVLIRDNLSLNKEELTKELEKEKQTTTTSAGVFKATITV